MKHFTEFYGEVITWEIYRFENFYSSPNCLNKLGNYFMSLAWNITYKTN